MISRIVAIYWLIFYGFFCVFLVGVPILYFSYIYVGLTIPTWNYEGFEYKPLDLLIWFGLASWFISLEVLHYFLLIRNKISWYIGLIYYIINSVISVPLLFQPGIWSFPGSEIPYELPWIILVVQWFAYFVLIMHFVMLYGLVADRKLFDK